MSATSEKSGAAPRNLFSMYHSASGAYDESSSEQGIPRPHWTSFLSRLEKLGEDELAARWENGRRIIREHGVTYNVYGDSQGVDRPWELDMVPLLLEGREWNTIAAGLSQRARLLNLILSDLYGSQRLLREGMLPPALVFANPGFLRSCHGLRVPHDLYLHLAAVDLARSPDGQWWALGDRAQSPSGSGYALENRMIVSRILPDEFRESQVERLASFFRIQRDTLRSLAPGQPDSPNVVLLTPGPFNETYFEQAYLGKYLGFTLVEGADLTVRNRKVYLKTLEGLQPVHVILRRVDDHFCDPLELRADSFLGVPGLVEAARSGNVAIANALGCGMIESPAFLAFLPRLCRLLLGEDLKLPSVATWWCGQAQELQYVIENLEKIVIKSSFAGTRQPVFGGRLSAKERASLIEAIKARPWEFVGQEQVALSTAPVWAASRMEARRLSVRAYVSANGSDDFAVMPGGLTRISSSADDPVVSMQSGGGSKDTWVLADAPVTSVSLLSSAGQPLSSAPISAEVPSRVADNLFWLGRYVERMEDRMRLLRCVITRIADEAISENQSELTGLLSTMVGLQLLDKRFEGRVAMKELEQELLALVYNPQIPGTVRELGLRIRQIASITRDRFSTDTWRILNQLQTDSRTRPGRIPIANVLNLLNTLIVDLAAFSGMESENMTRGHGWRFLDFGRRLERGRNMAGLCRAALSFKDPNAVLAALLEIADSSMTYRRRYLAQPQLASVLELLLFDKGNPRSFAFQLKMLNRHAGNFPVEEKSTVENEQKQITELTRLFESMDSVKIAELPADIQTERVTEWLGNLVGALSELSTNVTHHYFSLTVPRVS
jgi:uncharacterized circularly permuted ATP-grasp superfamily protein/uncharacterized alpha-E superfamily protein